MSFIDKFAKIGRPFKAPDSELAVSAQPSSSSLRELSKFDAESRRIECEIKNGKLRLDLSHVIGDKVVIKRNDALNLAYWIIGHLTPPVKHKTYFTKGAIEIIEQWIEEDKDIKDEESK